MTSHNSLRWLIALTLAATGLAHAQATSTSSGQATSTSSGQAWPSKPVRLVVPVAAGGATDLLARIVAEGLSRNLGQQFIVDGKPGAAGSIGSIDVARSQADGYHLLVATSSTHAVAPALSTTLRYDAVADFTPIALLAESNNVLIGTTQMDAKNVRELLVLMRAKPGSLNYVSSGSGSFGHLVFELFKSQTGTFITHIPYKGTAAAIPDMVAGQVHLGVDALPSAMPHVRDGRLRALAVTGPRRSPIAPDVPTISETVPGFAVLSWFGLYAPKNLPPELQRRINEEVNKVLSSPDVVARYATLGIEPRTVSPTEFAKLVAEDTARWSKLAKERNIKID
jgi:tripartite-type tricarboxylate transporter receptor subunit TctC